MNDKCYSIRKWSGARPEIDGKVFDPAQEPFCALEYARVDSYVWDPDGYCPEARAYVARTDEGLLVLMCAREEKTYAVETHIGGDVYRDSCLEFFLMGRPSCNEDYINFEVNVNGVPHIGLGAGRPNRRVLKEIPAGMRISHSVHAGQWWAVCYNIPDAFIREMLGGELEETVRANFYKCDESIHPHFGSWNPVRSAEPDFHRPESFGLLKLEA